jgi:hypothetical protein
MFNDVLDAAQMTRTSAAQYLGVSVRTVYRWQASGRAPQSALEALRRARWIAPDAAHYLEYLGVLRGIEHGRRCAPDSHNQRIPARPATPAKEITV